MRATTHSIQMDPEKLDDNHNQWRDHPAFQGEAIALHARDVSVRSAIQDPRKAGWPTHWFPLFYEVSHSRTQKTKM